MKAPDFSLPDLNGNIHQLSDYQGRIVWLEFWTTWCAACQESLAKKEIFYRSLKTNQVAFLTIHVSGREPDPDRVYQFVQEAGFHFPVLRDHGTRTYDAYRLSSVPTDVLITPNGETHGIYDETAPFTTVIQELGALLSRESF